MEPRALALAHARGRMLVGAAFVLAPGLAGRLWIGGDAARRARSRCSPARSASATSRSGSAS